MQQGMRRSGWRVGVLIAVVSLIITAVVTAQVTMTAGETITFAASATGFTASTLTLADGRQVTECSGRLETAQIRFYLNGSTPTASDGVPLEVGDVLTISGNANLRNFKGIRTGGTSGVIRFQCGAR